MKTLIWTDTCTPMLIALFTLVKTWKQPKWPSIGEWLKMLLSHFSRVWLCVTPETAAHQNPTCPWDSPGKNTGVGCHFLLQCMKVESEREVAQSCPTLRNPMDCSPPGFSVRGIFQARVLEWGAIAFSDAWVYLFVKTWLMKTVQSLGYHTVRVQLSRGSNSKDVTQSINQLKGAIHTKDVVYI